MKSYLFSSLVAIWLCAQTSSSTAATIIAGAVKLPVMGNILEQSAGDDGIKYILNSSSTKAHAPIDGSVFYEGQLKNYGLAVVLKNARRVTIVGNLDRTYVVKNQYVLQGDAIGSVALGTKMTFLVQNLQRSQRDYDPALQHDSNHLAERFQNKLFSFAESGANFIRENIKKTTQFNKYLSYEKIKNILQDIGFPEKTIPTMYCIAKWESGLNPKALNFNTNNTVDVGLFQINSTWFKKCNTNLLALYDEKENSRCALTVLQNQGFPAWTTYNKFKHTADYCDM